MARKTRTAARDAWPDDIYDVLLRERIRQVAYVPDAGHTRLIDRCRASSALKTIVLALY